MKCLGGVFLGYATPPTRGFFIFTVMEYSLQRREMLYRKGEAREENNKSLVLLCVLRVLAVREFLGVE